MEKAKTLNTPESITQASIRRYESTDLLQLMEVWESANSMAHSFLSDEYVDQVRRDIPTLYLPNTNTWVATINDGLVGFISLMGKEIGALFLLPEYHGHSIGTALTNRAVQLHGDLEVEVFEANLIGRKFYGRYGFDIVERKLHEHTGESVLRLKYTVNKPSRENFEVLLP